MHRVGHFDDAIHEYSRRHDMLRIDAAPRHQSPRLHDGGRRRHAHQRAEVSRCLVVSQVTQRIRDFGVKLKHNVNRPQIDGKRVVLVDDSIVRGTTSRKIVQMVRDAGAAEVHMRIASPPTVHPCFYGIDTPSREELLAARLSVDETRDYIGADSLSYVTMDGLYRAVSGADRDDTRPAYCDACFTGDYPVPVQQAEDEHQLGLFGDIETS